MRVNRRLSLPTHGAIEFLFGLAIMLIPLVTRMGGGALVTLVLLGAIQAGIALSAAVRPGGAAAHQLLDGVFILLTASCALLLAVTGSLGGALLLALLVALQALVNLATSYAIAA